MFLNDLYLVSERDIKGVGDTKVAFQKAGYVLLSDLKLPF